MYTLFTVLVLFLVFFSSACLYMPVYIDLCALTRPVRSLSFISIKFCSVLKKVVQGYQIVVYCSWSVQITHLLNLAGEKTLNKIVQGIKIKCLSNYQYSK